jgi:ribonucleoside-triphosphate reductase
MIASLFKTETVWSGTPEWELNGNPQFIHYNAEKHLWVNTNNADNWMASLSRDVYEKLLSVPEKHHTVIVVRSDLARKPEVFCASGFFAVVPETHNFVLGNGLLTGNCAFLIVENVFDIVDAYHLLLQGCGVGFRTRVGSLYGFPTKIPEIAIIRSNRTAKGGRDSNHEYYDKDTKVWTIQIGDSSDAWAKAAGKVVAGKYPGCKRLVLDFSQVRPAGTKLSGYGWLSCGDELISKAFVEIFNLLNDACSQQGQMLTHQQIHDIMNLLGTTLSNRRSAEISLFYYGTDGWEEFATCKSTLFERDSEGTILKDDNGWFKQGKHWWRDQSNNTVLHTKKPSKAELVYQFELMRMSGGSEPGIGNEEAAKKRAPWFSGFNPCVEILLANRGFCNLVTVNLSHKDHKDFHNLLTTIHLISRANYRQTLVNLDDGILHRGWHENNQMLRLCGVSLCGVVQRKDLTEDNYKEMRFNARNGATSMAQELGLQIPKNITCIKPEGTAAKVLGTLEQEVTSGVHQAIGRYEFNTVNFGVHEPIVKLAREANYLVREHPTNPANVLITFPVFNGEDVPLLNNETALDQLNRYKMLMANWCDQNVSCTVYYSVNEVPKIIDWLLENWDNYVGVSFLYRQLGAELGEPEEVACKRLGYAYLPQRAVSKEEFETYTSKLKPIDLSKMDNSGELIKDLVDCSTGACPVR